MAVVLASGLVSPDVRAAEQQRTASPAKEPSVHAIVTDPTMPSTIYVGTDDGLALSDDGGKTWTLRPFSPPQHVYALALDPRDHSTLWAGTGRDLRRSRNRGSTWTTMTMPGYRVSLGVRMVAKLFDLYSDDLESASSSLAAGKYPVNSIVVVPGAAPAVLAGAIGVLRSVDDGASWQPAPVAGQKHPTPTSAAGINALVADPHEARTLWAVSDGGVLQSNDAGATWRRLEGSPSVTSLVADPNAPHTLYAGTVDSGVVRSVDGGATWTPLGGDRASAHIGLVALGAPNTLYATILDRGSFALFMSADGGRSWIRCFPGESNGPQAVAVDPRDPATIYVGEYRGLWKTTDGGMHWSRTRIRPVPSNVPVADLVPTAFTAHGLTLSFSVTNAGTAAVPAVRISHAIYLSSDDTLGSGDTLLTSEFWSNGVAPGATYSMKDGISAPIVPVGNYFLILQVDPDGVFDADESNNVRAAPITLTFDPAAQLKRLQDIYEQGGMGEEEYKQERDFVLDFVKAGQGR